MFGASDYAAAAPRTRDFGDSDEDILKGLDEARLRGLGDRLDRDWNQEPEEISEEDQTFDADGRPK